MPRRLGVVLLGVLLLCGTWTAVLPAQEKKAAAKEKSAAAAKGQKAQAPVKAKPQPKPAAKPPAAANKDNKPDSKPGGKPTAKPDTKPAGKPTGKPEQKPAAKQGGKSAAKPQAEKVSFVRQVAPILVKKCLACHGPRQPKSNYQVTSYQALLQEGDFGSPPVVPGKPEESMLYELIAEEDDPESWMPKEADRLPEAEIAVIRRWIEQGAPFDGPDKTAPLTRIIPRVYDPAPQAYPAPLPVTALAFSPDGKRLVASGYNELTLWDPESGKLLGRWGQMPQRIYDLEFSPDGKLLAVAGGTPGELGEAKLLDAATGRTVRLLAVTEDVVFAVAFSPDGKRVACGGADRAIRIFETGSGKLLHKMEDHADWVMDLAWSPDGKWLVSASRDKTAKVFEAAKGQAQTTYNGHGAVVYACVFSADGKSVFTAAENRRIHQWNPQDGKKQGEMGLSGEVFRLVRADGFLLACASDRTARQYQMKDRKQVRVFGGHSDWVYSLAVHLGSKRLATGTFDGKIFLWNLADGKQLRNFYAAPGYPKKVAKK